MIKNLIERGKVPGIGISEYFDGNNSTHRAYAVGNRRVSGKKRIKQNAAEDSTKA